jgi:hypothetical protein
MGHELAVSCHNCYTLTNEGVTAIEALDYIHDGQAAGADLIEIDLIAVGTNWQEESHLNETDAYQIIGAYDGDGGVRLWIDGKEVGTAPFVSGGVTHNDSAIVVGADPQGNNDERYFFSGKIQQVNVQK